MCDFYLLVGVFCWWWLCVLWFYLVFCGVWFFFILIFSVFRFVSKYILEKCLELVSTWSLLDVCTGIWTFSIAGVTCVNMMAVMCGFLASECVVAQYNFSSRFCCAPFRFCPGFCCLPFCGETVLGRSLGTEVCPSCSVVSFNPGSR